MVAKIAIHVEADGARLQQCCGPEGCGFANDEPYPARWCVGAMPSLEPIRAAIAQAEGRS